MVSTRRATALPPVERREAIVAATLPLMMLHGPSVTTRQIAEAAGVAEGTIFRVFPDKDALIAAVLEAAMDPAPLEGRLAAVDPTLPLHERLVAAVQVLQERSSAVWQLMSSLGYTGSADERERRRRRNLAELPSLVALLQPDAAALRLEPRAAARRLRAIVLALSHPALIGDEPLDADEIVATFLDGVRSR